VTARPPLPLAPQTSPELAARTPYRGDESAWSPVRGSGGGASESVTPARPGCTVVPLQTAARRGAYLLQSVVQLAFVHVARVGSMLSAALLTHTHVHVALLQVALVQVAFVHVALV
jgi:hypothetical protein